LETRPKYAARSARAIAVRGKFGVIKFEQVLTEVTMRRQAVVTAVKFGNGNGDALAGRGRERALAQRTMEVEMTLKRGRAVADDAKQIGHDAELTFNAVE
jgi:hypothetical protein